MEHVTTQHHHIAVLRFGQEQNLFKSCNKDEEGDGGRREGVRGERGGEALNKDSIS
jgi:hypothetical protein